MKRVRVSGVMDSTIRLYWMLLATAPADAELVPYAAYLEMLR